MQTLRISPNLSLEFSYTKDSTFVKILRQGLKYPLRGDDIRIGPNSYSKDRQPEVVENDAGVVTLLMPNNETVMVRAHKLNLILVKGMK